MSDPVTEIIDACDDALAALLRLRASLQTLQADPAPGGGPCFHPMGRITVVARMAEPDVRMCMACGAVVE